MSQKSFIAIIGDIRYLFLPNLVVLETLALASSLLLYEQSNPAIDFVAN
jgi:hypothetical protein